MSWKPTWDIPISYASGNARANLRETAAGSFRMAFTSLPMYRLGLLTRGMSSSISPDQFTYTLPRSRDLATRAGPHRAHPAPRGSPRLQSVTGVAASVCLVYLVYSVCCVHMVYLFRLSGLNETRDRQTCAARFSKDSASGGSLPPPSVGPRATSAGSASSGSRVQVLWNRSASALPAPGRARQASPSEKRHHPGITYAYLTDMSPPTKRPSRVPRSWKAGPRPVLTGSTQAPVKASSQDP